MLQDVAQGNVQDRFVRAGTNLRGPVRSFVLADGWAHRLVLHVVCHTNALFALCTAKIRSESVSFPVPTNLSGRIAVWEIGWLT